MLPYGNSTRVSLARTKSLFPNGNSRVRRGALSVPLGGGQFKRTLFLYAMGSLNEGKIKPGSAHPELKRPGRDATTATFIIITTTISMITTTWGRRA